MVKEVERITQSDGNAVVRIELGKDEEPPLWADYEREGSQYRALIQQFDGQYCLTLARDVIYEVFAQHKTGGEGKRLKLKA